MKNTFAAMLVCAILAAVACTQQAKQLDAAPEQDASVGGPPLGGGRGGALPARYKNANVAFGSISITAAQQACPQTAHDRLVCLAGALTASVTQEMRTQLQLPYAVADAKKWSNFPPMGYRDRVGVTLGEFDAKQLGMVKAMLVEAAGIAANEGYDELEQILNADDYLLARTGQQGFSSSNFHFAFLGMPGPAGTWELYFGGHHTAFANTYVDGKLAAATPSFRGVEPFGAFDQNGRTNDPMAQEQSAFVAMLASLTPAEQGRARLTQTFTDIVVGPQKDDNFPTMREGVKVDSLTPAQRALVLQAIATYVTDIAPADAATLMRKYEQELGDTHVAFSGTPAMTQQNDYVRIDGPSVWIEYSMQPGRSLPGIHPHSIWRDRTGDYAGNAR